MLTQEEIEYVRKQLERLIRMYKNPNLSYTEV